MLIRTLEFDEDEQPESLTVQMSIREAAYLAKVTGKHSSDTANAVMRGGSEANTLVYNALTGAVFNRYWDGGVHEYAGE
jgi:hypothetical protein